MQSEGKQGEGMQGDLASYHVLSGALVRENIAREIFQKYDKNASGRIDAEELAALFSDLGTSFDPETLRRFDSSGGEGKLAGFGEGELDFNEFVQLYNQVLEPEQARVMKVLMLGLDNSGKSMIMKALSNEDTSIVTGPGSTMPTKEMSVKIVKSGDVQVQLIEFGGMESIRKLRPHSKVDGVGGVIFVVNSADLVDSLRIREYRDELLSLHGEMHQEVPLLVFANKQDLVNAFSPDEVMAILQIETYDRNWKVQGSSVVSSKGALVVGLDWVVMRAFQRALSTKSSKFSHK